jgi:hypothetical protein
MHSSPCTNASQHQQLLQQRCIARMCCICEQQAGGGRAQLQQRVKSPALGQQLPCRACCGGLRLAGREAADGASKLLLLMEHLHSQALAGATSCCDGCRCCSCLVCGRFSAVLLVSLVLPVLTKCCTNWLEPCCCRCWPCCCCWWCSRQVSMSPASCSGLACEAWRRRHVTSAYCHGLHAIQNTREQ